MTTGAGDSTGEQLVVSARHVCRDSSESVSVSTLPGPRNNLLPQHGRSVQQLHPIGISALPTEDVILLADLPDDDFGSREVLRVDRPRRDGAS